MKLLVLLFALIACGEPRERGGVVLWHAYNGLERTALEETAARWNAEHPETPLTLIAVPYDSFADKLTSAVPHGNGPDLFIFNEDRIGSWAESGIIEPIEFWVDDALADRFTDQATRALAYRGSLWGLPVAVKSLVLYVRTDLVKQPPRTTNELLALAPAMKKRNGYALAYVNGNLYFHAPWLHGFGGSVMDDTGRLSISTAQAADAMAFARKLVADGVAPSEPESPMVATLFNEGKAATVISGPWFVTDIAKNTPWQVVTLPIVSETGKPAAPFLGVESILMSSQAHDKTAAFAVMSALTNDAAAITRAKVARQVVANPAAYADAAVARDPALHVFLAQLEQTVPTPKVPAMRTVWTPYENALGEVLAGRSTPSAALEKVVEEVKKFNK